MESTSKSGAYSPFERALIKSLVWQIKGFRRGHVPENATKRILRATLTRIEGTRVGRSAKVVADSIVEVDHVIPLRVVAAVLLDLKQPSDEHVTAILDEFLIVAEITRHEHRNDLKRFQSSMPSNWDPHDQNPDSRFARYIAAGIKLAAVDDVDVAGLVEEDKSGSPSRVGEKFPLDALYAWAPENDWGGEALRIKDLKWPKLKLGAKKSTALRRAVAVTALHHDELLERFITDRWPFGHSPRGRSKIAGYFALSRTIGSGDDRL